MRTAIMRRISYIGATVSKIGSKFSSSISRGIFQTKTSDPLEGGGPVQFFGVPPNFLCPFFIAVVKLGADSLFRWSTWLATDSCSDEAIFQMYKEKQ